MQVIDLSYCGVAPARPVAALHPTRGPYWRFQHGEEGRGRKLVFFPLGARDFPCASAYAKWEGEVPPLDLISVSEGRAFILVRAQQKDDGRKLVLWSLSPGFRGGATYAIEGKAEELRCGYEAQGIAGRMGGAPCPVLLVSGPATLRWARTGRLYGTPPKWRAIFDGARWTVEPDDESSEAISAAFTA